MALRRQYKILNEAIEALDQRLIQAKGDLNKAWQSLTPVELQFAREEISNCISSRLYYFQNYHVIQPEQGILSILYPLYDHQHMIEEAIQKERDRCGWSKIIVLKPRQSGGTEFANAVMCHCTLFTPRAYTLTVAQNPEVAAHVQRKVNTCWDSLPWWLRPERQYHSKGEYLEFQRKNELDRAFDPGLGSVFVTTHAERESGVAIGKTIRNFHGTEVSRWGSGEIFTADIEPSMNALDTMGIMESAAFEDQGFFVNMWNEAVESSDPDWVPVFLPVYRAKKYSLPIKPGVTFTLTIEEQASKDRVGREEGIVISDEFFNWRRLKVKAAIKRDGTPYQHYSAYPMTPKEAFQSTGIGAFPRHKLDFQEKTFVQPPTWHGQILFQGMHAAGKFLGEEIKPGQAIPKRETENQLWIWEYAKPSETYYIGADVSSGQAHDYSAAPVWKVGKGGSRDVQVAEWHGKISPTEYAKVLYALGYYYQWAELAVEYAGPGVTTADFLFINLEYPKLYRPRHLDRIGKQMAAYAHWQTTMKTKTRIVTKMLESLLEDSIEIRSQVLLDELRKFRISSISDQGHISYSGLDSLDDDSMAAMIGLYCLRETLADYRSPASQDDASRNSPSRGARPSGGGVVYGIYDPWTRQRGQTTDLRKAEELVRANPGWVIRPILVTRANTAYSVIHHGRGAENDLWRQGVDQREITPNLVQNYRMKFDAQGKLEPVARVEYGSTDADDMNSVMAGQDWESADLE